MKLTQERLKEIILEELNNLSENPEAPQPGAESGQKVDPTKSVTQLKKDLLDASKNIQNVKGLDPKEIELISGTLGVVMQLASETSAGNILQRIYNVLQKQAG
tara:strand:+ start:552 stop:860 length:309 start_codon:yes stop_codon:yes gene_type:complete